MNTNPIIEAMLRRRSVRRYREEIPAEEVIETIVRAGQQAPFAAQLYSVLLSRRQEKNPFRAPLLFTICVDLHKMEQVMARRGWRMVTNDLCMLFFGIQDAALMAENMVMAAESLGLGSCFLGGAPYRADQIAQEYHLPPRVFPLVGLAMGYPAEDLPPRPRYPLDFVLFEDTYPPLDEERVQRAMAVMDRGYLAQDYYRRDQIMIELEGDRQESYNYDSYSWAEHISRKWGQWYPSPDELLEQLRQRGFQIGGGAQ